MDFLDQGLLIRHRSADVWRFFPGFFLLLFGSLTGAENTPVMGMYGTAEGPLAAESMHADGNRLAVEGLSQPDGVPKEGSSAPAESPGLEAAPPLSEEEALQVGDAAAAESAGIESAPPPVELLLAEDLFPQLRPILLAAADQAPDILLRNVDRAIAEANAVIARSDRYPSVGGLLRYDYRRENRIDRPDINNSQKLFYFFQARYPIYHWGAVKAASDIGDIGIQLAEGQMDVAYRRMVQAIRSQYLNLVVSKMDLKNLEAGLEFRKEELAVERERFEAGEIAPNKVGSLDFALREAQLAFDRLESEFQFSVRQFARLVGDESFDESSIAGKYPEVGHNPDQIAVLLGTFAQDGFLHDPRVLETELNIDLEKSNYRIYNVRNRPKLNMTAGITQDEINYDANIANKFATTALFVGVSLTWSIFDGFETRGLKQASLLRLNRLRMARHDLDRKVVDEANQAALRVKFAAEALDMGGIRLSGAKGMLSIAKKDYEAGLISEDSLESSRRSLRNMDIRMARLKSDYLNSLSSFFILVGADPLVSDLEADYPELGPEYERKP